VKIDWNEVYDILVDTCGAPEESRSWFTAYEGKFTEFRFQGNLGFGGKIYYKNALTSKGHQKVLRVMCYPEDVNVERTRSILQVNARLESYSEDA
jgi:hypothetical protein